MTQTTPQEIENKQALYTSLNAHYSQFKNADTDLLPNKKDGIRKATYKAVNKIFLERAFNKPIETIQAENKQNKALYQETATRLNNIAHDIESRAFNIPIQPKEKPLIYEKDTSQYITLNKRQTYRDISLLQVLKVLSNQHKISRAEYKTTLRRLKAGKQPQARILAHINAYYSMTIKAQSGKNSISALQNREREHKTPRLQIKVNNTTYRATIKRNIRAFSYSLFETEFKQRLANNNKIAQDNTATPY